MMATGRTWVLEPSILASEAGAMRGGVAVEPRVSAISPELHAEPHFSGESEKFGEVARSIHAFEKNEAGDGT